LPKIVTASIIRFCLYIRVETADACHLLLDP
jgi:hypothetical protein